MKNWKMMKRRRIDKNKNKNYRLWRMENCRMKKIHKRETKKYRIRMKMKSQKNKLNDRQFNFFIFEFIS